MAKPQIIDIDAEFDDVEFDEQAINRATGIEKRKENGWHKKNELYRRDPEYIAKVSHAVKQFYNTDEGKQKQRAKRHPQTESTREKIKSANAGKIRKGEAWIKNMAEKQKGNKNRAKKIMTPMGLFDSLKDASKAIGFSEGKIRRYTKELPWSKEWYYLTKDKNSIN